MPRVSIRRIFAAFLAVCAANGPLSPQASAQFFFIIPIPRSQADPDSINATLAQRKVAMCAAFHKEVIDPDLDGTRDQSWHGDVIHTAMQRLSDFAEAKKLVGAYMGQWNRQQKQSVESGRVYGRMLIEGCAVANLPGFKVQYDYWKTLKADDKGKVASLRHIPARPINLDSVITSADFPAGFHPAQRNFTTGVRLQIDRKGAVTRCDVEQPSGSDELDRATCALLTARARFVPAFEDGIFAVQDYPFTQTWTAP
jgi:TonB family protein